MLKLNKQILRKLKSLGATHYSIAKNFSFPHQNEISSFHFFSSDKPTSFGAYHELATFVPSLHISELGKLTGFHETNRLNALDTEIKPIPSIKASIAHAQ
jgi:hypothetical protein